MEFLSPLLRAVRIEKLNRTIPSFSRDRPLWRKHQEQQRKNQKRRFQQPPIDRPEREHLDQHRLVLPRLFPYLQGPREKDKLKISDVIKHKGILIIIRVVKHKHCPLHSCYKKYIHRVCKNSRRTAAGETKHEQHSLGSVRKSSAKPDFTLTAIRTRRPA